MKNFNFLQKLFKEKSYFHFSFANLIATSPYTDIKIEISNGDDDEFGDQEIIGIMISFVSKDVSSELARNIIEITNPALWGRKLNDSIDFYTKVKEKLGKDYIFHGDLNALFLFKNFPRLAVSADIIKEYNRLVKTIKWLLKSSIANDIKEFKDFELVE